MRIITGKFKGRVLEGFASKHIRPTTTRTKEAVFSMLTSGEFSEDTLHNARILELFSGTGAMSYEALSRGAIFALMVDTSYDSLEIARRNAEKLAIEEQVKFLKCDVLRLPEAKSRFDVVFIDAPYDFMEMEKITSLLHNNGWLKKNAILVIETAAKTSFRYSEKYSIVKEKIYGKSKITILQYS